MQIGEHRVQLSFDLVERVVARRIEARDRVRIGRAQRGAETQAHLVAQRLAVAHLRLAQFLRFTGFQAHGGDDERAEIIAFAAFVAADQRFRLETRFALLAARVRARRFDIDPEKALHEELGTRALDHEFSRRVQRRDDAIALDAPVRMRHGPEFEALAVETPPELGTLRGRDLEHESLLRHAPILSRLGSRAKRASVAAIATIREDARSTMSDPREAFDTGLRLCDLDPGRPVPLETPWGSIALFAIEGDVFAVQSFCPHLQGPLFQGTLSGEIVTCPWHQWRFSLRSGERIDLAGLFGGDEDCLLLLQRPEGGGGTILFPDPAPGRAPGVEGRGDTTRSSKKTLRRSLPRPS